jgi:hypothetical protein
MWHLEKVAGSPSLLLATNAMNSPYVRYVTHPWAAAEADLLPGNDCGRTHPREQVHDVGRLMSRRRRVDGTHAVLGIADLQGVRPLVRNEANGVDGCLARGGVVQGQVPALRTGPRNTRRARGSRRARNESRRRVGHPQGVRPRARNEPDHVRPDSDGLRNRWQGAAAEIPRRWFPCGGRRATPGR